MHKQSFPVMSVALGMGDAGHFLAIRLHRELSCSEIKEMCELLTCHLMNNEISMIREFSDREIHLRPNKRSAESFNTLASAIEEYQLLLESIGLGEWQHTIVVDGDLIPFHERALPEELTCIGLQPGG